jgi:hypothetical protein
LRRQVAEAVRLCFGRDPEASEAEAFSTYVKQHGLENFARLLFNSNEFLFVD